MKIKIRPENIGDYPQVAEITYLAFFREPFVDEMPLVDFLRHSPNFDPELSLVAEVEGKIIGHALFTPYTMLLENQPVKAALLAPVTVHPDFQRQGIGGQLLDYAHSCLAEKKFELAFLWGHPAYYPRFGYLPRMFGKCQIKLSRQDVQITSVELVERSVQPSDLETLQEMWQQWFTGVDLAILPGHSLADWVSHSVNMRTSTILVNEKIRGFVRYHVNSPEKPRLFLSNDAEGATILLGFLKQKITNPTIQELELPVHPAAKATREWLAYPSISDVAPWDACMIKILNAQCQPVVNYCEAVSRGLRQLGLPIPGPNFEIV